MGEARAKEYVHTTPWLRGCDLRGVARDAVPYVHIVLLVPGARVCYHFLMDLIKQLQFESEDSPETVTIRSMKEMLAKRPDPRGDKLMATFKISRDRHGELLAAVDRHGMTVTDVLTVYIDQIIPVLQRAKPIDVPGYIVDKRTKAAIAMNEIRKRIKEEMRKEKQGRG